MATVAFHTTSRYKRWTTSFGLLGLHIQNFVRSHFADYLFSFGEQLKQILVQYLSHFHSVFHMSPPDNLDYLPAGFSCYFEHDDTKTFQDPNDQNHSTVVERIWFLGIIPNSVSGNKSATMLEILIFNKSWSSPWCYNGSQKKISSLAAKFTGNRGKKQRNQPSRFRLFVKSSVTDDDTGIVEASRFFLALGFLNKTRIYKSLCMVIALIIKRMC